MTVLRAPAKLTWSLHVVGRRADGHHLLDAEMVALDLADTVELEETTDDVVRLVVRAQPPATAADTAIGDDNLVARALELTGRRAHAVLTKRVPMGAGLGGGSADAAAVLRWAGELDPLRAATLGADVPFCLRGGIARVRGVGEDVEQLDDEPRVVTLALPAFGVDTAACYRAFDGLDRAARVHPRNDLTAAAFAVAPALAAIHAMLEARCGVPFFLAGSGSTLFCEGDPLGLLSGGLEVVESADGPVRLIAARSEPAER